MKKIFTLFVALLALAFCAKAQVTFVSEGFESPNLPAGWTIIDADGDGYNWDCSTPYGGFHTHSGDGCIASASYVNNVGALTPDNWLITPQISVSAGDSVTFWYRGQDASYVAENFGVYVSTTGTATTDFTSIYQGTADSVYQQVALSLAAYVGQNIYVAIRHYNVTDMFWLNIDDIKIGNLPTTPTLNEPAAVDFGQVVLNTSSIQTVGVTAYSLTNDITVTTTAPFAVSADGTTFGTTATLTATTGAGNTTNAMLYVKYTPTALGTDNGTLTLASTGANSVVANVTGTGMDCSATIPYSYDFTNDGANQCWTVINANNDNYTFEFNTTDGWASIRYNSSLAMDDWLISPVFALTGGQTGSVDYRSGSASWFEKLQIFAIGANDTVALTSVIEAHNTTFETVYFDLSSLTGNYQLAIHGISDADQLRLYVTNVNIYNGAPTSSMTVSETDINFSTIAVGSTSPAQQLTLTTVNVNEAITLTTAAPFEISLDGTAFATTQTIPANSAMVVDDIIYVRFAPTTVGNFNQNLTISATSLNATVALTGASADCSGSISTFPFLYDFNTGIYPPICWGYNDADNYNSATVDANAGDYALYVSGIDMLVTPEINSNSPMAVMFGYRNYLGSNYDDNHTSFRVGYSTTNDNASSFTWMTPVTIDDYPEGDEIFATYSANIPANTKYVAIDFTAFGSYYDGYYEDVVYIDNFSLLTDATMLVSPESISFGSIIFGASPVEMTANVTTALLTSDINVTAPANFEVSANGTSYAATATLPQAGGTLYIRYNPTAAGSHNGIITLASGSISKTIAVSGSAMDCSGAQDLPFVENFDNGSMPSCWLTLDEDGDGYTWESSFQPVSYFSSSVDLTGSGNDGSTGFMLSGSFSNVTEEALNPDNWLISPTLAIPSQGGKLSFYVAAQDASYAEEHYGVYVSTTGVAPSNFTLLYEETIDEDGGPREQGAWKQKNVNLPYAGQNIHIAIRHFNCTDMFLLNLDDFTVTAGTGVESHGVKTVVFPNPANNVININSSSNINRVEIFNMMGQMVGNYNVNDVNTQINTSNFANGVYTVKIETENGMSTKKFTVAR